MRTHAVIEKIYKVAPDVYSTYTGFAMEISTHRHGTGRHKITDFEACALTVGEKIWVDAGWNEGGNGCYIRPVKPIEVITADGLRVIV